MGKSVLFTTALLCALGLPGSAMAQEAGDIEVSGGFSYLFADLEGSGLEVADFGGLGFHGGATFFLGERWGLGTEVGYTSDDLDVDLPRIAIFPPVPLPDVDLTQWTVLFGPRFRLAEMERFRVGAQVMAGFARGSIEVEFEDDFGGLVPVDLDEFDFDASETVFAALLGVHVDLPLRNRLLWRIVRPEVLFTSYGDEAQSHFRLSSGLVYGF